MALPIHPFQMTRINFVFALVGPYLLVDLHKQKRNLADSLLEGTDAAGKVSAQELLGLLQTKNQPGWN
ncbi:MAG: hypothetical protein WBB23_18625 [Desulforhopalus sp.]